MINKQNLFALFAAISSSALPLHAAEEKEAAASLELGLAGQAQALEAAQELADQEEKRVDLYKEGIHALTRLEMARKNNPIAQAFEKITKEERLGILALLRNWAFPPAKLESANANEPAEEPVFNFELFSSNGIVRVPLNTKFSLILDSNSINKEGQTLLDVDPNTWLQNPTITNRANLYAKDWGFRTSDNHQEYSLCFHAIKAGTSRFTLDNTGPDASQYWIDIVVE
jgi:hypothetical protein